MIISAFRIWFPFYYKLILYLGSLFRFETALIAELWCVFRKAFLHTLLSAPLTFYFEKWYWKMDVILFGVSHFTIILSSIFETNIHLRVYVYFKLFRVSRLFPPFLKNTFHLRITHFIERKFRLSLF